MKAILILLSGILFPTLSRSKNITMAQEQTLPAIHVSGEYFIDGNGKKFTPWGVQYGAGALMDDNWYTDTVWAGVKNNLKNMRDLGANIIRIHLEYNKFMLAPDKPNKKALDRLKQLVDYAEQLGVYLDVTGLACYRASDTPPWYNNLNEKARWASQAVFWGAIAKKIGSSNAVMDYDLINEPVVPPKDTDIWLPGKPYGGYNFLQYVTRTPAGRSFTTIMRAWIQQLTASIRKYDKKTLITVGLLPFGDVAQFSKSLDYVSVHIYPETGKIQQWVDFVARNSKADPKPLIIEEIYPLSAGLDDMKLFMQKTKQMVTGYISYSDGKSLQELKACTAVDCAIQAQWTKWFMDFGPGNRQ